MKEIIIRSLFLSFAMVCLCQQPVEAQISLPQYPDSIFSTYYHQRVSFFESLPSSGDDVIFIGNSITEGGSWAELFKDARIRNMGISSDISAGVIKRIGKIAEGRPSKIFLMIGTNDLARNISADSLVKNILIIAKYLKQQSPSTKLFVQSILPVSDHYGMFRGHTSKGLLIREVNERLKELSPENAYSFVDLHKGFSGTDGKLKKELTNDGLHLTGKGYQLWKHLVFPYVYGLQEKAAILPQPQKLQWNTGYFSLSDLQKIIINHPAIMEEAKVLRAGLHKDQLNVSLEIMRSNPGRSIRLQLGKLDVPMLSEEAYSLEVNEREVVLTANTAKGIFYGVQSLIQLARDGEMIDACSITDWPSFAWRGYMIDVGRNYMSMDLLKQQIDVMAKYKLNIFHFHPTEDIAWRIQSKQNPQLTAPEHMLRNKGMYYSEQEIKELIAYCRARHITFVPEIDMPGHSAAFKRAMKTDMQTDSGLLIVKKILREFNQTYDLPYIHIGADEVKITNQQFIPEVTALLKSFDKEIIGWEPGGNFDDNTIRQLWMDDNRKITGGRNIRYIDSRHLYLNHMDPLESVVTIFNRQIGNRNQGDSSAMGATLCVWHDRAVSKEEDVLRMNPVYPGILAFAERVWRGGGQVGWIANISDGDEKAFDEFERRLLDHKALYFQEKLFPYVKQSDLNWKLFGPYTNNGDLSKKFVPETPSFDPGKIKPAKESKGGTIVLRHWWANLIKGAVDNPKDSSTWYASSRIWCDETGEKEFWIGFNNISRSPATDSPPLGAWDHKGSAVWVNGKMIAPPDWRRPSQKGHPEIPLTDEGYEYREPVKIQMLKGWNNVLIKAPVGSFKGNDWQNPVKWMFTFVPVNDGK
jgi:hexosaminidase